MKYVGMWMMFSGPFRRQLMAVCGCDADTAAEVKRRAKAKYREIIAGLPEFEKADRFKMNLVNCALLGAFVLNMPRRPVLRLRLQKEMKRAGAEGTPSAPAFIRTDI